MCRGWRFREPEVPGAIAPVPATPEMTQEVGIRNCRLYTKPGDAVASEFEARLDAVEDLAAETSLSVDDLETAVEADGARINGLTTRMTSAENRITALENGGGGGGTGAIVGSGDVYYDGTDSGYDFKYTLDGGAVIIHLESDMSLSMPGTDNFIELVGLPADMVISAVSIIHMVQPGSNVIDYVPVTWSKAANANLKATCTDNMVSESIPSTGVPSYVCSTASPYYFRYFGKQNIVLYKE